MHICNVKVAYQSTNTVNYIRQMLKPNDWSTRLYYMDETLSYLAMQGWYDIDSAKVFNLLSATDKQRNTCGALLLSPQHCQDEPFFRHMSPQVHHLRESHVRPVYRCIKLTSLRDASEDFRIPNFGQLFRAQVEENRGYEVSGLVLRSNQNVLLDGIFIKLQNGLWYYHHQFHSLTSVECLELDCNVEYTDTNQGIMPESYNICVQYTESDLDNTFPGRVPSFPVLYFSWTPLNQILQFQELLPARKAISTLSKQCQNTQQWILCPPVQEYCKDPHGWVVSVAGFIRVIRQTDMM
jgi:hypothetical protein